MYQVQHAGGAFGNVSDIHKWFDVGTPTGLGEASAVRDGLLQDMKQRCGPSAWDDHFRVVPTTDTTLSYHYQCLGPVVGTPPWCRTEAEATVTVPWAAGEMKPYDGDSLPAGWGSIHLCPVCAERERRAIMKLPTC